MFYREAGQFRTSYAQDSQIFPLRQDRIGIAIILMAAVLLPFVANAYWLSAILIPWLVLSLVALGQNILMGYAGQLSLGSAGFMQQVHERAYDFTRFTQSGHRWLFRRFSEVSAGPVGGAGVALAWYDTFGTGYVRRAFERVAAVDRKTKLVLNEAQSERDDEVGLAVRRGLLQLVDELKHAGVPLHAQSELASAVMTTSAMTATLRRCAISAIAGKIR